MAPLHDLTRVMLEVCPGIRCMRDPTRGGVSSALNELAVASRVGVELHEPAIPLRPEVRAACEMLGLDPLYVANEGKLIAVRPPAMPINCWKSCAATPWGRAPPSSARWSRITQAWLQCTRSWAENGL